MRDELEKLEGKRLKYRATFSRFGKKQYNSQGRTILLTDVYQDSTLVAEHIWADYSPDFMVLNYASKLNKGTVLEFMAVARPYLKDARFRTTGLDHNPEIDSSLTEIEDVNIIEVVE